MSVIFKALSKLERQSWAADGRQADSGSGRGALRPAWRFAALLLVVAGGVAVLWIHQVKGWAGQEAGLEPFDTVRPTDSEPSPIAVEPDADVVFQPAKGLRPVAKQAPGSKQDDAVSNTGKDEKMPSQTAPPRIVAKVSAKVAGVPPPAGDKGAGQDVSGPAAAERDRIITRLVRQRKQTASLVADIRRAMDGKDFAKAGLLLDSLAAIKGEGNLIVRQLRAYWMIKTGRLQEAEAQLNHILEVDPDDLEAAINLAVVQIKTGRLRRAKEVLEQLYLRFPEDDRIGRWLDVLER